MDHLLLAQVLLSCLCAIQGIATGAIDFNKTHATNPLWIGHARFHVVWQSATLLLLSALELALIWIGGRFQSEGFYLASLLAAVSPVGFLTSFVCCRVFGGALSDPNGIPPLKLEFIGAVRSIDLNLAAVLAALISLAVIIVIYRE